jgi:integrase
MDADSRKKVGRPRKGTICWTRDRRRQAIVTLADGSRKRLDPFPRGISEALAREKAAFYAEKWANVYPKAPAGETITTGSVAAWFEQFARHREARGLTSVRDDRGRFARHVAPVLGRLAMTTVRREDIEQLVRTLDAKVQAGELSWKTAQNTWVLVSKMFRESVRSKAPELRVRGDNPCAEVAPPDRGVRKSKVYIFPSELGAFLSCPDVPLRWRRMVVVSVYLGVRAGELDALHWEDIDLDHGIVQVHRALDRSRPGEVKSTKTGTARRFRIEPNLLPLLKAMHAESGGEGTLFPRLKLTGRSEKLRMFLRRAKVNRAELHASDATRKPLGWHDLRASCATWLAVRGEEPLKIMQRLGHRNFNTTMLYVREAEQLREGFGDPFPALPDSVLQSPRPQVEGDRVSITLSIAQDLSRRNHRAGHGTRTRDPELGKLVLYQLS